MVIDPVSRIESHLRIEVEIKESHVTKAWSTATLFRGIENILGGKNPHPQSTIVGGVTCGGELSPTRLDDFRNYLEETLHFIHTAYIPDLKLVADRYKDKWTSAGGFTIIVKR